MDFLKQNRRRKKYYAIKDAKISIARENFTKFEYSKTQNYKIKERRKWIRGTRNERDGATNKGKGAEDHIIEKAINNPRLSDVQPQYFFNMQDNFFVIDSINHS